MRWTETPYGTTRVRRIFTWYPVKLRAKEGLFDRSREGRFWEYAWVEEEWSGSGWTKRYWVEEPEASDD